MMDELEIGLFTKSWYTLSRISSAIVSQNTKINHTQLSMVKKVGGELIFAS